MWNAELPVAQSRIPTFDLAHMSKSGYQNEAMRFSDERRSPLGCAGTSGEITARSCAAESLKERMTGLALGHVNASMAVR